MKRTDYFPHWFLPLIWAVVVILLTTMPLRIPLIRTIAQLLGGGDVGDAIGHAFLFGSLTLLVYRVLRLRLSFALAFWGAVALVIALGTTTEFLQRFSAERTVSLSDLLANFVGVLGVATLISFFRSQSSA